MITLSVEQHPSVGFDLEIKNISNPFLNPTPQHYVLFLSLIMDLSQTERREFSTN